MSSPRITFQFSNRRVVDPWWVRLAQEGLPEDTATLSDAADLLDTLYNLDACDGYTLVTDDVSEEKVDAAVEVKVSAVSCLYDADGNVDVVVRVIRSRQDADYRLALSGGTIKTTETRRETVTQQTTLKNGSSLTLDYPVIDGFSAQWLGAVYTDSGRIDSPPIRRAGNTLEFDGVSVAAGTISATYLTEYDRCTVTILGDNGQPGECTARVFFHGLVEELALETPDAAEAVGSCTERWQSPESNDEVTCYREVTISTRCECSDHEVSRYTYEETVTCPEYVSGCPGNDRECMRLMESVTVPEYVACDGDNQVTGRPGKIYALSTPEYYREKCCGEPPSALPKCPQKTTSWRGSLPIAGGADQYFVAYGPQLRIVPVSPPGGICGTWTIKQEIRQNGCCDEVAPLAWDGSVSPEVIAPNSAVDIAVTGGGKYPYVWTLAGEGFQFPNGSKQIITTASRMRLSALALACGWVGVTVTDGCTTVRAGLRCTAGEWKYMGNYFSENQSFPFNTIDMLRLYCGSVLVSGVYLAASFDGSSSQISDDGRYWMGGGSDIFHTDPILPGQVGRPFRYVGAYTTKGVPLGAGCLDGFAPPDPIVGAFRPILAKGCTEFEGGMYSRTASAEIHIYEWGC